MAANPMASRSAALAGAAQALNKPKLPGGRQDLSGATGGTIQGAHGGTQQLGDAAKRRLGGQQSPPIVAPNPAGGGLNPDAQKPGTVGLTKPMALPGFMSALPKPDPGMQIFGADAKVPGMAPEAADMVGRPGPVPEHPYGNPGGAAPPIPPEMAQMLSERLSPGGAGSGSPDFRGVRDHMMGAGTPGMGGASPDMQPGGKIPYGPVAGTVAGALPGFGVAGGIHTAGGMPFSYGDAMGNVHSQGGGQGPMGAMPGARPKPGMPTKPLETDPAGAGGGVWGRIAGGGARPKNTMASF